MMDWLFQPWPAWLSGILIGLTVPALFLGAGKAFGISTSLQEIGCLCTPNSNLQYLKKFDWRGNLWTVVFAFGMIIGGFVAQHWLSTEPPEMLPEEFGSSAGLMTLLLGGVLVGFGTRYAGGCTSGHSITGIANLNWPSLVATIFFFVGGLAITWGIGNFLFSNLGLTP